MIISICNEKAGVGKSTTGLNLAAALRDNDKRVCYVDLDTQQDLTWLAQNLTGVERIEPGRDLRETLTNTTCDYLLIDCPPKLDPNIPSGLQALQAISLSNVALVPVVMDSLVLRGLERIMATISQIREAYNPTLDVRLLTSIYSPSAHKIDLENVKQEYAQYLCKTRIPRSIPTVNATRERRNVLDYAPDSPAAKSFRKLAKEVESWPVPVPTS